MAEGVGFSGEGKKNEYGLLCQASATHLLNQNHSYKWALIKLPRPLSIEIMDFVQSYKITDFDLMLVSKLARLKLKLAIIS